MRAFSVIGCIILAGAAPVHAATVHAAVAANFTKVAETLGAAFKEATGNEVVFSFGATGALYTQITQGAPFEVFFAADDRRTANAIADGFGVAGSEFTYAIGRLALYSPTIDVTAGQKVLSQSAFQHLAVADPATAPYGAAAMAVLDALELTDAVSRAIVTGENITQTLQYVDSGSAELGFVALSQVIDKPTAEVWIVPQTYYREIRQNAVLLKAGQGNAAARAFLDYVMGPEAAEIVAAAGYGAVGAQ